jgi:hypothetical protein
MDPEIRRMLDEHAIVALTSRYCWALDRLDRDALAQVFLADAVAELGARCEGFEAIWERVRGALSGLDGSQHVVGSHVVEVDGDEARSRCYLIAQHIRRAAEGGPHWVVGGMYEDRVVRTPDGWRIAHRVLTPLWTDGNLRVVHEA